MVLFLFFPTNGPPPLPGKDCPLPPNMHWKEPGFVLLLLDRTGPRFLPPTPAEFPLVKNIRGGGASRPSKPSSPSEPPLLRFCPDAQVPPATPPHVGGGCGKHAKICPGAAPAAPPEMWGGVGRNHRLLSAQKLRLLRRSFTPRKKSGYSQVFSCVSHAPQTMLHSVGSLPKEKKLNYRRQYVAGPDLRRLFHGRHVLLVLSAARSQKTRGSASAAGGSPFDMFFPLNCARKSPIGRGKKEAAESAG